MSVSQGSTNMWVKVEFNGIAALSKRKFNPQKEANDRLCVELEHIEKETGRLLGTINSAGQLSTKNAFRTGDVLFGKLRPNLRKYIHCDFDGVCSSEIWVLNAQKKTNSHFLFYLIQQEKFIRSACITSGSKMPRADWAVVSEVPFPLPPLPEQKAIADLLSTWDEAIEKTERLIQAKEKRFKRLLHDLIYLPTKEGKWKQIKTKSLFKERKENKRGDLPLLSITNGEGVIPREDTNRKDTSNEDKSKYLRICPGDIGYNTMRMWQGVSALSSLEGIVSPAYTICIPGEKLCPLFVAYLFKMPFMIHRFYRYSQGLTSDTWNLKFPHFSEVKMPLPSIDEQEQIAETLSAARQEIDLLKQLADKYKTQKRGLMQKMLTGEWRVKPEKVKTYEEV
ncbi:restriction endonuclease subunit S [Syntrophotalea acetylenica]|uniref:restriction endonuclease subunit S n=1 Tax=Syntrophotalea acetylenica TaxID=29542 RepID=UPI002A361D0A|nr:restriction endonuclease subunit S [Syntrophotalea acetylenica]MDY0261901.1 restriction endonuclease subunit S [Syntrophotalea acetylenica]